VKAPANSTKKKGTPAASGALRSAAVSRSAPASAKKAVKAAPVAKKVAKPVAKTTVKTVAKTAVKAAPKVTSRAVDKAAPKTVSRTAAKPAAKAATKATLKPVSKSTSKVAAKSAPKSKAAAKVPAKSSTPSRQSAATAAAPAKSRPVSQPVKKTVVKTAVKPAAKPADKKSAASAAAPVAAPKPSKSPAPAVSKQHKAAPAAPAPIHVEPTARPLGKRAAKKVMMEQMTQAAVVPTHAPDAAKATFSQMNERSVMTPPVPSTIQKDPKRANNWKTLSVDQLTDQDVQAMPDSEYMNDLQLAYFRRKLAQLRADMLANAGETTEHLREDTVVVPDPADRATIEEEHALELRTRDRERKLLKKIEQAINRIDSGDYGYCEETGEPIGVGRLMARPTASLSLEAQQRRELKQKMFGD
jgi:DnaK suppressor protein